MFDVYLWHLAPVRELSRWCELFGRVMIASSIETGSSEKAHAISIAKNPIAFPIFLYIFPLIAPPHLSLLVRHWEPGSFPGFVAVASGKDPQLSHLSQYSQWP